MRADDYTTLGQLITEANKWRTAGQSVNVDINEIHTRFDNGDSVNLKWEIQREESTDPTTGEVTYTIVWEGWNIETS